MIFFGDGLEIASVFAVLFWDKEQAKMLQLTRMLKAIIAFLFIDRSPDLVKKGAILRFDDYGLKIT